MIYIFLLIQQYGLYSVGAIHTDQVPVAHFSDLSFLVWGKLLSALTALSQLGGCSYMPSALLLGLHLLVSHRVSCAGCQSLSDLERFSRTIWEVSNKKASLCFYVLSV